MNITYYASKITNSLNTFPREGIDGKAVLGTAPKYKYLNLCLYQLMEVGGGGGGVIWGERVTVHL